MLGFYNEIINRLPLCKNDSSSEKSILQILICGVGGQGSLHLSHNLARLVADRYQDIFSDEIHGIAQKRASVTSMIRCGNGIRSAFFVDKKADYVMALEPMEILRLLPHVGSSTICLLLDIYAFFPTFGVQGFEMPVHSKIEAEIQARGGRVVWLAVNEWLKSEELSRKFAADVMAGAFAATAGYSLEKVKAISINATHSEESKKRQQAITSGFMLACEQLYSIAEPELATHAHSYYRPSSATDSKGGWRD